jgi:hypothetical protein
MDLARLPTIKLFSFLPGIVARIGPKEEITALQARGDKKKIRS